ncbi:hypothetical protein PRZ48_003628 [Zasmidium cellare]|uniref:AB hydrolase-1 domain-containing protein n=1 Tax=Zasmidium cellare TaxID=395010 RepID=A0ABR0EX57_ZASCE|nr:hypothetical protein PRZ48_003628 [Zasmidium cellare]
MAINIIQTRAGPVEAEVTGTGIPILILHGSPGGIDATRTMSYFLDRHVFQCIGLSRPGYLNTPLSRTHRSIDEEADLVAALLDALQIPRVGGVAYQLAARHPQRVFAMVAIAAVSKAWIAPKTPLAERIMFGTKFGAKLVDFMAAKVPEHVVQGALEGEGSLRGEELETLAKQVMDDPAQRQVVLEMASTVNVGGPRKDGWQNDVRNFAAIKSLGLEQVQCPVLLIHGDADTDAVPSYSEDAHARLPLSRLVMMHRGTHLSFYAHPQAHEVQAQATKWFYDHAQRP